MSELSKRVITAAIGAAIFLTALFATEWSLSLVLGILGLLAAAEYGSLLKKHFESPMLLPAGILAIACLYVFPLWTWIPAGIPMRLAIAAVLAGLPVLLLLLCLFSVKKKPFQAASMLYMGVGWLGLPTVLSWQIATDTSFEPWRLVGIFFLIWASDIGAYFSGKKFGRHKLFERLSPKKTWEGFGGGALFSFAIAILMSQIIDVYSVTEWLIVALLCIVFGTLGDLTESGLKRSLQIKDSGSILPGHGGILDRFDAFFFSIPIVWIYLNFMT